MPEKWTKRTLGTSTKSEMVYPWKEKWIDARYDRAQQIVDELKADGALALRVMALIQDLKGEDESGH